MVQENARAQTSRTTRERGCGRHSMQFNDNSCGRKSGDSVTYSSAREVAAFSDIICSARFRPAMSCSEMDNWPWKPFPTTLLYVTKSRLGLVDDNWNNRLLCVKRLP